MFTDEELFDVMNDWVNNHIITSNNRETLKTLYVESTGGDRHTCTTCPNFWNEVQHHFKMQLKNAGLRIMEKQPKYIFAAGTGSIRLFGSDVTIVAEGEESDTNKVLTDELAESLIEKDPGLLDNQIIVNPLYVPEVTSDMTAAEKKEATAQADAAKALDKQQKADAKKAATKAAAAARKAGETKSQQIARGVDADSGQKPGDQTLSQAELMSNELAGLDDGTNPGGTPPTPTAQNIEQMKEAVSTTTPGV